MFSISYTRIDSAFAEALPDNWSDATDMLSFRPLDRAFIFPGSFI